MPAAASLAEDMMQLLRGVDAQPLLMKSLSLSKNSKSLLQTPLARDQLDDLAGGDVAGVGDIVGAERDAFFPASESRGYEFVELRN